MHLAFVDNTIYYIKVVTDDHENSSKISQINLNNVRRTVRHRIEFGSMVHVRGPALARSSVNTFY